MKNFTFKILLFLQFAVLFGNLSHAQKPRYQVRNYTPRDYGNGQEAQNWAITQDERGVLYFGNSGGVLEFDGRTWRFLPTQKGMYVSALAADKMGVIYVGTQYGFGYLYPEKDGKMHYRSLSDSLPLEQQFFSTIWKIHLINGKVYYQSEEAVFVWDHQKLSVINPETSFHLSFCVHDQLFVREREKGIMELKNGKFELVPGSEVLAGFGVFAMLPYGSKKEDIVIFTRELGIWIYDRSGSKKFTRIKSSLDGLLLSSALVGGIYLEDGNYVLNTLSNGLIILDRQLTLISVLNKDNSDIRVNDIKQVYQDSHRNLWLALENGIAWVNYTSPLSIYSEESGILDKATTSIRYNGKLYLGTSGGLYSNLDQQVGKFIKIAGIPNQVWTLMIIENKLYAGTSDGLYTIQGNSTQRLTQKHCRALAYIPDKKMLFTGGREGLTLYRLNGNTMQFVQSYTEIPVEILGLNLGQNQDGTFLLWAGTQTGGVFKIQINRGSDDLIFNHYSGTEDGLGEAFTIPVKYNKKVYFISDRGLLQFIPEEEVRKTLPDSLKNDEKNYRGFFEPVSEKGYEFNLPVTAFNSFDKGYFLAENLQIRFFNDNEFILTPFKALEYGKINHFFTEDSFCWISCDDALVSFDMRKKTDYRLPFKTLIRKVVCNNDSILSLGNNMSNFRRENQDVILKYSQNSLLFEFSSTWFDHPEKTQYKYYLQGFDEKWRPWTADEKAVFTNLREGRYILYVKSRNVYDMDGEIASYSFEILPPWYRTWWAYLLMVLLALALVFLAIQISIYRIKQKNIRLERIVQERTAEIAAKNVILQHQKEEIEKEKEKSEALLLNTLPLKVVNDLKAFGKTEPESFNQVTVYFSDVKGFTDMSSSLDPKFLIEKLNEMFTAFDDIMSKHGCERIKTIGDAYMAVCGMPEKNEMHAELIMQASIEILEYLAKRNLEDELKIRIRIGLNSGKVTGGIVGVRKYIYDVFGDTVNTASRMESNGEPMRINVSESTYQILKDKFPFEPRPPLEVKGKGVMNMYFLDRKFE